MNPVWDVIVVGAGIAGLSAATVVARGGARCLCIDRLGPGGVLINLGALTECPDLAAGTTGPDLVASLTEAAVVAGVELGFGEVQALRPGAVWSLETADETHQARAVIVATGLAHGRLAVADAARYEGQGLSHCATCDGPLYAGAAVVVAGSDRWALQEAIELSDVAGQVTLATGGAMLEADDPRVRDLTARPNVHIVAGRVVGLQGDDGLDGVLLETDGARTALAARAVFAYDDRRPELGFAGDALRCDSDARILVDDDLRAGPQLLFAAGDVRSGSSELVDAARGDGQRAGAAALQALNR